MFEDSGRQIVMNRVRQIVPCTVAALVSKAEAKMNAAMLLLSQWHSDTRTITITSPSASISETNIQMFLLVLAQPGCPRQNPQSCKTVVCVCDIQTCTCVGSGGGVERRNVRTVPVPQWTVVGTREQMCRVWTMESHFPHYVTAATQQHKYSYSWNTATILCNTANQLFLPKTSGLSLTLTHFPKLCSTI